MDEKKRQVWRFVIQTAISILTAIATALGVTSCMAAAENGGYPPTQNGDIRSLFWLFSLMALQN